jgi:predicted MFS family arabinose efflux permease
MVAFFGVPLIVIINGLSNLYSAITELFIHVPKTVQQGNPVSVRSVLQDTKAAVKAIFSEPCLQLFVPCALILNLLGSGPFTLMLPFCMEKGFTVDMYGYLMTVWTAASLACVMLLGIIPFKPKARFWVMAIGFSASGVFMILGYLSGSFLVMCIFAFLGAFMNCAGNTVFNASLMLALPEENRSAILGFVQSSCCAGTAVSAVVYGLLGEVFPLYLVFTAGSLLSLAPMLYMCFHKETKTFIMEHCE